MQEPLSLFSLLMTIGLLIGGIAAYRHGFIRTANEIQERVIHALQSEIQAMQERISDLEQDNSHLEKIIATICSTLKHYGISITIDGEMVNIQHHSRYPFTCTSRILNKEAEIGHETTQHPPQRRRGRKPAIKPEEQH